ncbi:alpha/beta hydrolase [Amycolatopsis rhabdoformis]|uniref:Alpha/beta hydrolase n=1 Tax=Amycolatopsis rhabdoformis TaxID=1448059 RepID=A0ABZ1I556_9PSEU|nr:alpha/beta hydrolase [Amycolatopsis rhabdoformis]WSE29520.1 alpha/beta hydrolase [Amycolatopsis rhabdoformis]
MAPLVVAVPGTLCSPAVFGPLARAWPGVVHAIDWLSAPGPWRIEDVAERIAARIDRPVLLVGHSTGGCIALQLAAKHPELVAGLLLANTGAHMRGHGDVDGILTRISQEWGPELHAAVLDRSFAQPLPTEVRVSLLDYAASVPQAAVLEVLTSQRDLDLTPQLASIRCPVRVLHGVRDRARSVADAQYLVAHLPTAELSIVDTGHTPVHEDVPATVSALESLAAQALRR